MTFRPASLCANDTRVTLQKYYEDQAFADDTIGYVRLGMMRAWRLENKRWFVQYHTQTGCGESRETMLSQGLTAAQVCDHMIDVMIENTLRHIQDSGTTLDMYIQNLPAQQTGRRL